VTTANHSQQIVQRLWNYCNVLRDDGLSYGDYLEQLTYLLFLKMAYERTQPPWSEPSAIPAGLDWPSLDSRDGDELETHYRHVLEQLGREPGMLGIIFRKAQNKIQDPAKLKRLISDLIDREQWTALDVDVKGDAYEGLLERNAQDTKGGAGQYFTPRPLIRAIVDVMQPRPGETICDPACGTGGFLLAAYDYISERNPLLDREEKRHLRLEALRGVEIVDAVTRLCAMNLFLHGIGPTDALGAPPVRTDDSLRADPGERFDLVLTNPPFGRKSSVLVVNAEGDEERQALTVVRDDFWASTSNKQLNFVQHVKTLLNIHGRAAVVVPDNVLFEGGAGETIRRKLLHECDVHTLLRLPTGIFYAQGVKANVLFFERMPASPEPWTRRLWIYDLRTNVHITLKTNPLRRSDLDEFVACYNPANRHERTPTWTEENPAGRWRAFGYDELLRRDKVSLDIFWLKDESLEDAADLAEPDEIAAEIVEDLRAALDEFELIAADLDMVSKPSCEATEADQRTGERQEGDMDLGLPLVADGELAEAGQPRQRALDHRAMAPQLLAGLDPTAGDPRPDAALGEKAATAGEVVALVGMHLVRPLAPVAVLLLDGGQRGDQPFELHAVVLAGRRQRHPKRDATCIGDDMVFAARLPTVRGVRPDQESPFLAGTLRVSTTIRRQSSWPASPSSSSSSRWSPSHTPACCQASTRRQTVTPLPKPNSVGRCFHWIPVRNTYRMPLSTARSLTRGRPPLGLGGSAGSNGAMRDQSASETRHCFMPPIQPVSGF
jgi:type I restriction enzyme M protein